MKVLITRRIPRAGIKLLEKAGLQLDYRKGPPLSEKELKDAINGVDAIIPVMPDQITRGVLEAAGPNLKLVAHYAVGYDNIDIKAAAEMGIYVSNTPGDLTEAVAEHSLSLMLAVSRHIVSADRFTRAGNYKYWDPMVFLGSQYNGATIGIIGLGRIGSYLAKLCKNGFNMNILYYDAKKNERAEKEINAVFSPLENLLTKSDFVSIHVPLLPTTKHLIGMHELKQMKPTAFLINTSRGPVIDEDALIIALKEDWIAGAALDVYEEEPSIRQDLKDLDNVILTPHIASATRESRIGMSRMAAENIIEVLVNKKSPINLVNKDINKPRN